MTETEVLIVGAGPAGIAAATAAAQHGRKVMLLDGNAAAGGQIWRQGIADASSERDHAKDRALRTLQASGAELRMGWRVFDAPSSGVLLASDGNAVESFRYERVVIATGARERFLPFPGWTLPGVFGAGGLQALAKGGYAVAGKRVVVSGSGPLLLAVAVHLRRFGAEIVTIAEQAPEGHLRPFIWSLAKQPGKLAQAAGYRIALAKTPYRTNCWPVAALGKDRVLGIRLTDGRKTWEESCEMIACGFHLVPNTELPALLGCSFNGDFVAVGDDQQTSVHNVYCAGEPTGISGLDGALIQGEIAGLACADELLKARALRKKNAAAREFAKQLEAAFELRGELRALCAPDTIVCRCEDVRFEQLAAYDSWTEAKLQTRCGMGPCQGRVCGPATQALFGWKPSSVRPPLFPVPVSAYCDNDVLAHSTVRGDI